MRIIFDRIRERFSLSTVLGGVARCRAPFPPVKIIISKALEQSCPNFMSYLWSLKFSERSPGWERAREGDVEGWELRFVIRRRVGACKATTTRKETSALRRRRRLHLNRTVVVYIGRDSISNIFGRRRVRLIGVGSSNIKVFSIRN